MLKLECPTCHEIGGTLTLTGCSLCTGSNVVTVLPLEASPAKSPLICPHCKSTLMLVKGDIACSACEYTLTGLLAELGQLRGRNPSTADLCKETNDSWRLSAFAAHRYIAHLLQVDCNTATQLAEGAWAAPPQDGFEYVHHLISRLKDAAARHELWMQLVEIYDHVIGSESFGMFAFRLIDEDATGRDRVSGGRGAWCITMADGRVSADLSDDQVMSVLRAFKAAQSANDSTL